MSKKLVLLYQNDLFSNSLMYKLSKTFSEMGYVTFVIGVSESVITSTTKTKTIVIHNVGNVTYYEIVSKIKHGHGIKNTFGILSYIYNSCKILKSLKNKIDIIYSIDLPMTIASFIFFVLAKKNYVYHIADKFSNAYKVPTFLKPLFNFLDFFLMKYAKAIVIADDRRITEIPQNFQSKTVVIYNSPVDVCTNLGNVFTEEVYEKVFLQNNQGLKIAYFGILSEDRFIRELITVVNEFPDLELHIGGFGPLEKDVLEASKRCKRVIFYGKLTYPDVLKYTAQCDLLVAIYDPKIPNNRKASPNKLYEAMMLGKPIIVGKEMGLQDIVEGERIGLAVDYDLDSFREAISILRNNKTIMLEFSKNTRRLYETKYSWEMMKKRLNEILEKL